MIARTEDVYTEAIHAIDMVIVGTTVMNWYPMVLYVVCVVNFFAVNDMPY